MYSESDLLPLSGLQHILFCERQCAFIHVEREWAENRFTAEGRIMHDRVHVQAHETRKGVRAEFSVAIRSFTLGVTGQADVVEYHPDRVRPVEYKRGREKKDNWDRVQLCAQALCLEEMLSVDILEGDLFYGKIRRRRTVRFDDSLREQTRQAAERFHDMIRSGKTPPPTPTAACKTCSFVETCLPRAMGKRRSVHDYLNRILKNP